MLGSALLRGLENRTGPLSGDTRFRGLSRDEVGTTLEEMRAEVDAQTTMMLMASFEAELMVLQERFLEGAQAARENAEEAVARTPAELEETPDEAP